MSVNNLDLETIKAGLADGSLLIVDVREPHEFAAGRIPGSVCLPLSRFDPSEIPAEPGRQVVFSCAAGIRSLRAIEMANAAGLAIDSHYSGGFRDWAMRGEPVER